MTAPLAVYVVRHTHWDREWYHPASRFRQRLVALVDELLDRAGQPEQAGPGSPFLLDGQTIVLDDYLAVRPERRDVLAAALQNGALEAGPWYVLADELIPSGEALVRNLLAGRRALAAFDAAAPPVLYAPDAFGHAAALPLLAEGFGCGMTIVWRGYGGARWPQGAAAWWQSSSGARTLLWHLAPDGYELGSSLPTSDEAARERWAQIRAQLAPRAHLALALVPNGADHHAPQNDWPIALDALRRAASPDRVLQTSLAEFAFEARRRADAATLPVVHGELRDSYGYAWALQGTFATRTSQKRRNAGVQRLLERDVEPWLALLALRDREDARTMSARSVALSGAAWRTLLRCHPHDTLCGCSTDEVARAADARWDSAVAQGCGLRDDALATLLGHDADHARTRRDAWQPSLVVRNRAPYARGGAAEVELTTFVRDVAVGPGSAGRWEPVAPPGATPVVHDGRSALAVQILDRSVRHERIEAPRHYPDDDLVEVARALVWLPPVEGLGLRAFAVGGTTDAASATATSRPDVAPSTPDAPVVVDGTSLDNGAMRVDVGADGAVAVRACGMSIDDLIAFDDVGDAGDLYTHSPVGTPIRAVRRSGARVLHRGPVRGEVEIGHRLRVPAALRAARDGFSRPSQRASRSVDLPISVRVSLDADAAFVRIRVRGANAARDHRLRIVFRTGVMAARVLADAAFGAVDRLPLTVSREEAAVERPPNSAPLHRWVALIAAGRSCVLVSDGLGEYEALPNGDVAVTLVRAVGELSRPDLPERPGHAGWPVATPEAQQLGPFEATFGFTIRDDPVNVAAIERMADDVLLPLTGTTLRSAMDPPASTRGIALHGDDLVVSAIKPSEDAAGVVLRCRNVGAQPVDGAWTVPAYVDAWSSHLDERWGATLPVEHVAPAEPGSEGSSRIRIRVAPHAVTTIVVVPTATSHRRPA